MKNGSIWDSDARMEQAWQALRSIYRYGMLVFILGVFALAIVIYLHTSPEDHSDPHMGFILSLMLLFNHLTGHFKWRRSVAVALEVLSVSWMVFGCFYICHLSHLLFSHQ
jgi:hypothetical protein